MIPMASTRFAHRRVELVGGPLDGCGARVYRTERARDMAGHLADSAEPATLTLCLGALLPDWRPAGWVTYHRHPDGTYRWNGPAMPDTPTHTPSVAADAPNVPVGHPTTPEGVTDGYALDTASHVASLPYATGNLRDLGISVEDIDPAAITTQLRAASEALDPITRLDGTPWLTTGGDTQ